MVWGFFVCSKSSQISVVWSQYSFADQDEENVKLTAGFNVMLGHSVLYVWICAKIVSSIAFSFFVYNIKTKYT